MNMYRSLNIFIVREPMPAVGRQLARMKKKIVSKWTKNIFFEFVSKNKIKMIFVEKSDT